MRIISQDETIDVPYNFFSLSVASGKCKDVEYACIYCHNISAPHGTKLAEYSSKEKALKAMEMLRETFFKSENEGIYRDGGYYYYSPFFQFPKDDEVEV
jgi:hypothetical protein|nr:MAG TPA: PHOTOSYNTHETIC REACTION CENTER CYTOCHROME C, LIPIDIC-SPONGE PHASE, PHOTOSYNTHESIS, REACTION [Bacteriophage sp.]